jgi:hypothetical protein
MRVTTKKVKNRRLTKSAESIFQHPWFVEMIPSPIHGEVRLRMTRPSTWISIMDAAELMACSVQKVHNLCEEGALDWRWLGYEGAGGKKLVLVDSIHRYIAQKSQLSSSRPHFSLR